MIGMKANVSVSAKENDIQHKLQSKSNQTQSAAAKVKTPAGLAFYPTAITQSHAFGFKGKKELISAYLINEVIWACAVHCLYTVRL